MIDYLESTLNLHGFVRKAYDLWRQRRELGKIVGALHPDIAMTTVHAALASTPAPQLQESANNLLTRHCWQAYALRELVTMLTIHSDTDQLKGPLRDRFGPVEYSKFINTFS